MGFLELIWPCCENCPCPIYILYPGIPRSGYVGFCCPAVHLVLTIFKLQYLIGNWIVWERDYLLLLPNIIRLVGSWVNFWEIWKKERGQKSMTFHVNQREYIICWSDSITSQIWMGNMLKQRVGMRLLCISASCDGSFGKALDRISSSNFKAMLLWSCWTATPLSQLKFRLRWPTWNLNI